MQRKPCQGRDERSRNSKKKHTRSDEPWSHAGVSNSNAWTGATWAALPDRKQNFQVFKTLVTLNLLCCNIICIYFFFKSSHSRQYWTEINWPTKFNMWFNTTSASCGGSIHDRLHFLWAVCLYGFAYIHNTSTHELVLTAKSQKLIYPPQVQLYIPMKCG